MHRPSVVLLALGSVAIILGGCNEPTGPDADALLARVVSTGAPTNLAGGPVSQTQIDLTWQDNSRSESGFELYRSTAGAAGAFAFLARTAANVASYSDAGLTPSTEYCYKVRWYRSSNKTTSTFSDVHCTWTFGPPPAPSGVSAVPMFRGYSPSAYSSVDVTWTDNRGTATGFRLERSSAPDGAWFEIARPAGWQRSYTDSDLPTELQVCYRLIAFNTHGDSPHSAVDCTTPPAAPSGVVATSADAQSIDVAWTDNASEDGYEVQRLDASGAWTLIASPPANVIRHHDAGLTANTRYWYRLRARKDGGVSDYSASVSAVPVGEAPPAPSSVDAWAEGSTSASVYWVTDAPNVESFRVERSIDAGASWDTLKTTSPFDRSVTGIAHTPEQRVCYRVFAVNRVGDSPASSSDCVTTAAEVEAFAAAGQGPGSGSILLTWKDVSRSNTGYSVQLHEYVCGYYECYESWTEIASVAADAERHLVEGLDGSTYYQFRIVPVAPDGNGTPSPAAGAYPDDPPPPPPADLTSAAMSSDRISVHANLRE